MVNETGEDLQQSALAAMRYLSEPQEEKWRLEWMRISDLVERDPGGAVPTVLHMIDQSDTAKELGYVVSELLLPQIFHLDETAINRIVHLAECDEKVCASLRAVARYEGKLFELERCLSDDSVLQERTPSYVATYDTLNNAAGRCRSEIRDVRIVSIGRLSRPAVTIRQESKPNHAIAEAFCAGESTAQSDFDDLRHQDPVAAWKTLLLILKAASIASVKDRLAESAWILFSQYDDVLLPAVIEELNTDFSFREWMQRLTFDGLSEDFVDGVLGAI